MLDVKAFVEALRPVAAGPVRPLGARRTSTQAAFEAIAPHAQTRLTVLSDITANVDFLFLRSRWRTRRPGRRR